MWLLSQRTLSVIFVYLISMKQILSIEELIQEATLPNGQYADFFIMLNGGARSSKQISYNPDTGRFDVINEIDFSYQFNLSIKQLASKTHILLALENGALYKY